MPNGGFDGRGNTPDVTPAICSMELDFTPCQEVLFASEVDSEGTDASRQEADELLHHVRKLSTHIQGLAHRSGVNDTESRPRRRAAPARRGIAGHVADAAFDRHMLRICTPTAVSSEFLKLSGPSLGQSIVRQYEEVAAYFQHQSQEMEGPKIEELKKQAWAIGEDDHVKELLKPIGRDQLYENNAHADFKLPTLTSRKESPKCSNPKTPRGPSPGQAASPAITLRSLLHEDARAPSVQLTPRASSRRGDRKSSNQPPSIHWSRGRKDAVQALDFLEKHTQMANPPRRSRGATPSKVSQVSHILRGGNKA